MSKDKNYGPMAFEKAWIKQLNNFNETKVFLFNDKSKTIVKYIDGDQLLGIEMYRCQFEIDYWLGHFQHYLDTGTFDTNAYWAGYNSFKDADGKLQDKFITPVTAIPMVLEKKLWSVHSPEMNQFMHDERLKDKGMGFKQQGRPMTLECKWCGDSFKNDKIKSHEETCDYVIPPEIKE